MIQVDLMTARQWFFSEDPFKREMALKAYDIKKLQPTTEELQKCLSTDQLVLIDKKTNIIKNLLIYAATVNGDWKKREGNTGYFIQRDNRVADSGITKGTKFKICNHTMVCQNLVYFREKKFAEDAFVLFLEGLDIIL